MRKDTLRRRQRGGTGGGDDGEGADTMRCLRCNVNLCPNCWNEWHGVDMRDTYRLLGR
jgi:hypothetical protein